MEGPKGAYYLKNICLFFVVWGPKGQCNLKDVRVVCALVTKGPKYFGFMFLCFLEVFGLSQLGYTILYHNILYCYVLYCIVLHCPSLILILILILKLIPILIPYCIILISYYTILYHTKVKLLSEGTIFWFLIFLIIQFDPEGQSSLNK